MLRNDSTTEALDFARDLLRFNPHERRWMARSAGVILITSIIILGLAAAYGAIG